MAIICRPMRPVSAETVPEDLGLLAPLRGFEGPRRQPRQFHPMLGMESQREIRSTENPEATVYLASGGDSGK